MTSNSLMYRTLLVLGLTIGAVLCVLPTVLHPLPSWLSFLQSARVSLGLDLQGGTHLVMSVDVDQAVVNSLEINADEMRRELRKAGVKSAKVERVGDTALSVTVPSDQRDKLSDLVGQAFPNLKLDTAETIEGNVVQRVVLPPDEIRQIKQQALDRTAPPNVRPGRYRPPDPLLTFLQDL